jgi:hypothetical protein
MDLRKTLGDVKSVSVMKDLNAIQSCVICIVKVALRGIKMVVKSVGVDKLQHLLHLA